MPHFFSTLVGCGCLWLLALVTHAQDIQVRPQGHNTYQISVSGFDPLPGFAAEGPAVAIGPQTLTLTLTALDAVGQPDTARSGRYRFRPDGAAEQVVTFAKGKGTLAVVARSEGVQRITAVASGQTQVVAYRYVPPWLSLLPPLLAIVMALIFREVMLSLFAGVFVGALLLRGWAPLDWLSALLATMDTYLINALLDRGHASVIIFSIVIGGMVAIISRNGGMAGIVVQLSRYARSPRSTQFITWLLGVAIFFDDYANLLIVGNTMRPVTDRFRVSREKLAYIVDSTAAPVAAVAFVTTWIGAEIGYIKDASASLGIQEGAYAMFLNSLRFSFYPVFTLAFILMLVVSGRDFGPMLRAERRARQTGQVNPDADTDAETRSDEAFAPAPNVPLRWYNALLPVLTVVLVTLAGLGITGIRTTAEQLTAAGATVTETTLSGIWPQLSLLTEGKVPSAGRALGLIIGNADAYVALLWASLSGLLVALLLTLAQRLLPVVTAMENMLEGFKAMMPAMVILLLAWALSTLTEELRTADYLTSLFSGNLAPGLLPFVTFLLAAIVAFSTGSSWGTMAILYPLMLPATWAICQQYGLPEPEAMRIFYNVISVVLAGAVFGDHCSPISDTTILSSLSSGCPHIAHVRTQLPYAAVVAVVSLLMCLVSANLHTPWWLNFPLGLALLWGVVRIWGRLVVPLPKDQQRVKTL